MLAFSIAPDACNGIEYYTFLRRAYTKGIPLLSNTKLNIRKYFPEKTKIIKKERGGGGGGKGGGGRVFKKKQKKKKTISFSGYGFMEPDLLV